MISNLLLLTGEETFLLREKLRFYKKGFGQKYSNGLIECFETKSDFKTLENSVLTPSLFGEKRLVVLEGFWTPDNFEKAEKADFFNRLPDHSDHVTLLCVEPSLDKRTKSAKFLLKNAKVELFDRLDSPQLESWLCDYSTKQGGLLKLQAAQVLVSQIGANLWSLTSELKKLVLLSEGTEITKDLILANTVANPEVVLWDFLSDVSQKRTQSALKKLRGLMDRGESIYQILAMLNREIRIHTLLKLGLDQGLSEKAIATETKLHPFVVKKTLPLSRKFEMSDLVKMYETLVSIDLGIKTGRYQMSTDDQTELVLAIEKFIVSNGQKN